MLQRLIRTLTGALRRRRRTPGRTASPKARAAQSAVRAVKRKM